MRNQFVIALAFYLGHLFVSKKFSIYHHPIKGVGRSWMDYWALILTIYALHLSKYLLQLPPTWLMITVSLDLGFP
jgi:hypothetical protein